MDRTRNVRSYKCIRSKGYLESINRMERCFKRKDFDSLYGFQCSSRFGKEGWWKSPYHGSFNSSYLENNIRKQNSTFIVRVALGHNKIAYNLSRQTSLEKDPTKRDWEVTQEACNRVQKLFIMYQLDTTSFRFPSQFQNNSIHNTIPNIKNDTSRRILNTVEETNNQLVLCSLQPDRKSADTLYRIKSPNDPNSSHLKNQVVVATGEGISS